MQNIHLFQYDSCIHCVYCDDVRAKPMARTYLGNVDFYCKKRNIGMMIDTLMTEHVWCGRTAHLKSTDAPTFDNNTKNTDNTNETHNPKNDNPWANQGNPFEDLK